MASGLCLSKTSTAASRVYIYTRDQLVSGQGLSYAYDDIANRTVAEGKTYVANALNQYTQIDDFSPQYGADGNQTLIKTETGVWSVVYNAENRPVRWTQGDTVITMAFDRLGRRVEYCETRAGQVATHFRFVYDNFLCIQQLNAANDNAVRTEFVWDPTESIATRPLVFQPASGETAYYFHDGNKNVSEVFYHALQDGIAAHYDYAPFGAVTRTARVTNRELLSENPFRFSSEYHDSTLGLVYYNYRHYDFLLGGWSTRDPLMEEGSLNLHGFLGNSPISHMDDKGEIIVPAATVVATAFFCAFHHSQSVMESYPGTSDKFKHCLTSCRIAKSCGGMVMELAGLGKEARDRLVSALCNLFLSLQNTSFCNGGHGDFFDSLQDLNANHRCVGWESYAFGAVGGWVGALFRQSCECCCEREVGRDP